MEPYIPEEMKLAVKNGAAWLDEVAPEWVEKINLGNLTMYNCTRCILGQVFQNYSLVVNHNETEWAIAHGFRGKDDDFKVLMQEYQQLGIAWSDYIKETR